VFALLGAGASARQAPPAPVAAASSSASASHALITKYCIGCHNERLRTGGLALDRLDSSNPGEHAQVWEAVVEKLRAGSMPPPGRPRPEPAVYAEAAAELERASGSGVGGQS
jgi:mono/diheme cytochrome c family protein